MKQFNKNILIAFLAFFTFLFFSHFTYYALCDKTVALDIIKNNKILSTIDFLGNVGLSAGIASIKCLAVYSALELFLNGQHVYYSWLLRHGIFEVADTYEGRVRSWFLMNKDSQGPMQKYIQAHPYVPLYKIVYNHTLVPAYNYAWLPLSEFIIKAPKATNSSLSLLKGKVYPVNNYIRALSPRDIEFIEQRITEFEEQLRIESRAIQAQYVKAEQAFNRVANAELEQIPVNFLSDFLSKEYITDHLTVNIKQQDFLVKNWGPSILSFYEPNVIKLVGTRIARDEDFPLDQLSLIFEGNVTISPYNIQSHGFKFSYEVPLTVFPEEARGLVEYLISEARENTLGISHLLSLNEDNIFIEGYCLPSAYTMDSALQAITARSNELLAASNNVSVTMTAIMAGVVGMVTHIQETTQILATITGLNEALVACPELGLGIIQYLQAQGHAIPEGLRQFWSLQGAMNPQDTPFIGFNNDMVDTLNSIHYLRLFGVLIVSGGILLGAWYLWSHGLPDLTPVTQTAQTLKESLEDKYVNILKK